MRHNHFDVYVGNRIRTLRKEKGVKQKELAVLLDVQVSRLSYWESGRHGCATVYLARIAVALSCQCFEFFPPHEELDELIS